MTRRTFLPTTVLPDEESALENALKDYSGVLRVGLAGRLLRNRKPELAGACCTGDSREV